jgi:acetylornithine deacetylase/succinyl-diaminopimelate desuccinylase-like protein
MPADEARLLARAGLREFPGGISAPQALRKLYTEPTCTLCGLVAGYTGPGQKTVVPREATAKLDFRMVVGQNPHDIYDKLLAHLRRHGFGHLEVKKITAAFAYKTPVDSPFVRLLDEAARLAYGQPLVVEPTAPGSSPMNLLGRALGFPIAGIGVAWPGSNHHAPDECIRLEDYRRGVKHAAAVLDRFAGFEM